MKIKKSKPMIDINKLVLIPIITAMCFINTVYSQQFEGVITYKQIENNNSLLSSLIKIQQRPGAIERYMNRKTKVYIAGDTLICESFDSMGVLINTTLQIGDTFYSRSNYGNPIFTNVSHIQPSIAKIKNWKQVTSSHESKSLDNLTYYIGSESTNPNMTTEIGLALDRDVIYDHSKVGFFRYFFTEEGLIYHEHVVYKDLVRLKSNYHYELQEVSKICKNKIEEYYIEY